MPLNTGKPRRYSKPAISRVGQAGVSLAVVMMILVVVSLLGAGAAQIALMAERGARNDRDYQIAWQSADAALADAEYDIVGGAGVSNNRKNLFAPGERSGFLTNCGTTGVSKGLCLPAASGNPVWLTASFTSSSSPAVEFGTFTSRAFDAGSPAAGTVAMVKPVQKPRYLIEVLDDPEVYGDQAVNRRRPPAVVYRVTSMGFGPRADIQAVLQTLYRKD
ncbi:PilX N-terminal domain-containing pilus assembly protein [uncultured Xylophilus sp.]|uniref:pilus assembly PilX family protein n=1 Tax=uncultured Xylophilus sp. TaxID=296832 RepID=UPI0025E0D8DA|nr:PilX N-terminal domain-containing pilus assembly protein [uncultured Xylophilus sp.]